MRDTEAVRKSQKIKKYREMRANREKYTQHTKHGNIMSVYGPDHSTRLPMESTSTGEK